MSNTLRHHRLILGATLGVGIGLSILATAFVSRWETSNRQLRFQQQIENLTTALQRSLNRYTDLLAFLGDYYTVDPAQVDRQAFANFVARSLQSYPGIQALEWAPLVSHNDRRRYEQTLQAEGYIGFEITELGQDGQLVRAAQRPYYIPVTYIEPLTDNESAFGYDLYSNSTRAIAIDQARSTGQMITTGRVRLVQETRDQFGFLVFQPIYQNSWRSLSPHPTHSSFTGVLLGVFRVSDVVEESLQDLQYDIDFALYDHSANTPEQFLGRYHAARKQVTTSQGEDQRHRFQSLLCPSIAQCTQALTVGDRQWSIVFSPSAHYAVEPQYSAITTLIMGLLLTSGLVLILYQLNRDLEQTQNLSDLRFRFFSMASHELRTPLSTILLSSESLQVNANQLTDDQKQANIQRIHITAKRMGQQISDLLMLTRAEVGKLDLQPEILDLDHLCQQIIEDMQIGIRQPIQFTHTTPNLGKAFLDKLLVVSLLTNLISNAAKYSPTECPIQVTLKGDVHQVRIQIRDYGIGIPPDEQERIWEAFYRGSNVGTVTGSGLGLAVVKTCVDRLQGKWSMESQVGEGTTVTIQLPLE